MQKKLPRPRKSRAEFALVSSNSSSTTVEVENNPWYHAITITSLRGGCRWFDRVVLSLWFVHGARATFRMDTLLDTSTTIKTP